MKKPGILLRLLLVFMKVGFFTFGGGYAMISLIEHLCVEREGWITHDEMMNVVVIAESTPGPIAINCATFVGYRQAGLSGTLAATLGIVLPSFAVIYLIASRFDRFLAIRAVSSAFRGIKLSVGLLVLDAGIRMVRKMPKKARPRLFMAGAFLTMGASEIFALKISSIALLSCAALLSLALFSAGNLLRAGREEK
ncbi:chromate transporter [Pyramidobacter sp. YE332]|uniref:chromate transporter n=1 Tax=Pyramidobacter sp. YE332 TaxID=3068894 RepID=UPI00294ABF21|nr:chromate transporter [Pyramidobacter sp. YE332]WOL40333.1 chromate transporter [Pyramidobacter sp. YE332]